MACIDTKACIIFVRVRRRTCCEDVEPIIERKMNDITKLFYHTLKTVDRCIKPLFYYAAFSSPQYSAHPICSSTGSGYMTTGDLRRIKNELHKIAP